MMLHRRLLALIAEVRSNVVLMVLLGLLIAGTYIGQGLLTAQVVIRIFERADWASVLPLLGWALALVAVRAVLLWLREIGAMATSAAVKQRLRRRLYTHLLALGPGYLERTDTGTVRSTLVDGVEALEGYLGYYIPQAFVALATPVLILVVLVVIDPLIGGLTLVCALLVPVIPRIWDRVLGSYGSSHWQAYSELGAQFLDSMQGMTTLKAFNASAARGEALRNAALKLYQATMAQLAISMIRSGVVGLAMGVGTAVAVGVGALRLANGNLDAAGLFIMLFLVNECFRPLVDLDAYWHQGYMGVSASSYIFRLLDTTPEVQEPARPAPAPSSPAIAFAQVSFAYLDGERPALDAVSFTIAPGETVALVGRSGAGKSTVVSLLLRFFDPQQGEILLGGRPLADYDLDTLRSMIAVVSQDTYLFHGSVAANLQLGKPNATRAELEAAAHAAKAHDFIAALPQGYDTIVGERGMKLSGGERQRIAIARALLKDAPILLLDEATASIDAANEALIQEALAQLTAERTTLVIAHRLSTVVNADRIIVLDQGRVVESGRHRELLDGMGAYARLVAAQQVSA
ncbi:MAG: thiol reductant ABC exporter subunit CydD [Blastochloris sp.]|nr:thiol reductant ABC exporter subunit CydD [Blastochloris sp.]